MVGAALRASGFIVLTGLVSVACSSASGSTQGIGGASAGGSGNTGAASGGGGGLPSGGFGGQPAGGGAGLGGQAGEPASGGSAGETGGGGSGASPGGGGFGGTSGGAGGTSGGGGGIGGASTGGTGGTTSIPCMQKLQQLGIGYTTTVAKGVVDGVKLTGPLNGVLFAKEATSQVMGDPLACEFVLRLWQFADILKAHGFTKIGTLGAYCYRCCCYWSEENYCRDLNDPEPDCTKSPWQGYSNHSWGRAIDVRYLYKANGTVYDINNNAHWTKWSSQTQTCSTALAAQTGISKELYSLACELSQKQVFSMILTPNYSSTHRNHIHADIGQAGDPTKFYVYSSQSYIDSGDHCDE